MVRKNRSKKDVGVVSDEVKTIIGSLNIRKYLGMSESAFVESVQRKGLPAEKNSDGVWVANRVELDKWTGKIPPPKKKDWVRIDAEETKKQGN